MFISQPLQNVVYTYVLPSGNWTWYPGKQEMWAHTWYMKGRTEMSSVPTNEHTGWLLPEQIVRTVIKITVSKNNL
jgi:hypothetical protein